MNESASFGYQEPLPEQVPPPGAPGSGAIPGQYKFSPEELRVLAECNQESFFKRSMPIGTVLGFGTFAAIQKGYLRPNARFGVLPKVTLAVIVGYFVGKLSYQQACAEKLMALPGSYIGQLLRERRDGKMGPGGRPPGMKQTPTMFGANSSDIYSDAGPGSALDLDTDRPIFSGDDSYRPDNDAGSSRPQDTTTQRPMTSYDDLRKKNRGEYSDMRQDPYRMDPSSMPPITRPRAPAPPPPSPPPRTNKYGDSME